MRQYASIDDLPAHAIKSLFGTLEMLDKLEMIPSKEHKAELTEVFLKCYNSNYFEEKE